MEATTVLKAMTNVTIATSNKDQATKMLLTDNPDPKLLRINSTPREATSRSSPTTKVGTRRNLTSRELTMSLTPIPTLINHPKATPSKVTGLLKISTKVYETTSTRDPRPPTRSPIRLLRTPRELATITTRSLPSSPSPNLSSQLHLPKTLFRLGAINLSMWFRISTS